ncbi:DUF1778 domain-containing protein [Pseudomonas sp. BP8]|uniref:type II toxin-antitoxin system TacA family antitoxin n=1 Tax=Pseudomonas sp. BP8 TaxID=2817864 RepID=UPI001AE9763D|nr:DUF1778 domain-containing protein [Pseudomonas sp. BP8]MBP2260300.1 uncharacterized protein (DUF1778 family) [Pseudomonas sp. BP8]HDS1733896.1 DUF1778 domain-containing protein [Pseudomonas putida]
MPTPVENLNAAKTARLDLKTTEFAKEFIRKAATISGLDMTSFIMASAFKEAEAVMENYNRLKLSEKAFSRLHEILREGDEEATPPPALVKLMRSKNTRARDR